MNLERELDNALHTSQDDVMKVFKKIYEKYCRLIYYFIHKRVDCKEDCEDLTNDVFLKFFNGINNFDTSRSIKKYLFAIADNKIKDYLNSKTNNISYEDCMLSDDNNNFYELHVDYPLMIDEFKDVINDMESKVIIYHVLYDYTFKEIANYLNISINTIKSAYKRGIKKLREYYELKEKKYRESIKE